MTNGQIILIFIFCFFMSYAGCSLALKVHGRKTTEDGFRDYLDRKEEELNEKIQRKKF